MSLTKKDIDEIMHLLESSTFDRLSLEVDGMKLELTRAGAGSARKPARPEPVEGPQTLIPTPSRTRQSTEEDLIEVLSPLLGVFYRAPKPGEPPFVEVGTHVEEDSIIGIIEVMKLMNSARAGVRGEVVEFLAINGEMVEHGEVLMLVRPD